MTFKRKRGKRGHGIMYTLAKRSAMKVGGAVAVLGIGMAASQIGTPHLLTTYECDTDGRKCIRYTQCFYIGMQGWRKFYPGVAPAGDCPGVKFFALDWPPFIWRKCARLPSRLWHRGF